MIALYGPADAAQIPIGDVRALVERRFAELAGDEDFDPGVLGHFVVIEEGDDSSCLVEHLGFSPLENRYDGSRFHDPAFTPSFEVIEEHEACFEIVFVLCDDGTGVIVFVPKAAQVEEELLALCRQYAVPSPEPSQ